MMDVRQFQRLPKPRLRRAAPVPGQGGMPGGAPAQSPGLLGGAKPQTYGLPGAGTTGLDAVGKPNAFTKPPWLDEYYDHWARQKTLKGPLVGDSVLRADAWSPALQGRYQDWRGRQRDPDASMTPRDFILSDEMTSFLPLRGAAFDAEGGGRRPHGVMPIPGVLPEAARAYLADQVTPGEARFVQDQGRALRERHEADEADETALRGDLRAGRYDVENQVTPGLQAQMTGRPDLSAYDPVVQHALNKLNDQFERRTLRSVRQGAEAAGQTGGTREGIAEGLAAQGLTQAQSDLANRMYLGAYQDAQPRVLPATELGARLNERASEGRLNNQLRLLRQNAYQDDQAAHYIDRMMALWGYPGNRHWENLDRYSRLVQGMNLGNSVSQPLHRNKWAGALGGGLSGYAATGNPWGAGLGALAGLLGSG